VRKSSVRQSRCYRRDAPASDQLTFDSVMQTAQVCDIIQRTNTDSAMHAITFNNRRGASGRVTKFSGEPFEDDVSTLHPVGGTA
jgi:hypothetical protein